MSSKPFVSSRVSYRTIAYPMSGWQITIIVQSSRDNGNVCGNQTLDVLKFAMRERGKASQARDRAAICTLGI